MNYTILSQKRLLENVQHMHLVKVFLKTKNHIKFIQLQHLVFISHYITAKVTFILTNMQLY